MKLSSIIWNFLYKLSSPKYFYIITGKSIGLLKFLVFILIAIGAIWGLFFTPADYLQGDAFRIIYIHVPCAFLSLALYAFMGFLAILLLVWRIKLAGIVLTMTAQTGALITFFALITGSIWGKPMWGGWWVWDARLTSELVLLLFYFAILAIKKSFVNKNDGDKIIAVLTIIGLIDLPIVHFSVNWWNTLHQGSTIFVFSKPKIAMSMAYPLFIMILGFGLYCAYVIILKTRNEILLRESRQSWVLEQL
jgi:heme exporter protein C